ncbi:MAG: site-specific DNA-methyltransferase, partial [Ignavibacteria bacterium]|nr:site-specific DNA-methyltransferase [Ignavibacteria bacterium]
NSQEQNQSNLIKEGDVFQLGNHILACGKAEDKNLLEKILADRKVNLILIDPPYGCSYVESKSEFSKLSNQTVIENDQLRSEDEYSLFTKNWLQNIKEYLEKPNNIYIFNTDKMALAVKQALEAEGGKMSQLLIWAKSNSVVGRLDYSPKHELIIYGWIGKHKFYKSRDKTILCFPKPNRNKLHPTMKPIALLRHLILNSSRINDVVWDGFLGSGSTLIACQQTRRICVGTEISPDYCEVIIDRFRKIFPDISVKKLEP